MSTKIPIIDISAMYGTDLDAKMSVAKQIDAACRTSGFFQISNHGVTHDLDTLTRETFRFFHSQTQEQKLKLARKKHNPESKHIYRGFFPASVNGKEGFDIGNPTLDQNLELTKLPLNELTQWPDESLVPGFRAYFQSYYESMAKLATFVLRAFALAIGKEETFFDDKVKLEDCMSTLRLNYYPFLSNIDAIEIAADGTRLGCETHKDTSLITILYQPIEGLQVEDAEEGWINIVPSNKNYVINTGRLMARWTNDTYQAANHRVKFLNIERVSVPFFTEPSYNCLVESFTPGEPEKQPAYEPITYGAWLTERLTHLPEYQSTL